MKSEKLKIKNKKQETRKKRNAIPQRIFIYTALLGLFYFISSGIASAADVGVSASIESSRIGLDESTVFTVTVSGTTQASPPSVPSLDFGKFQYLGPSTQISILNGQASSQITFQYYFIPEKEGSFTIPPVEVAADKKTFKTTPLPVTIVRSSSQAPPPGAGASIQTAEDGRDVLITMETDKSTAYVDQQILLTMKIYTRADAHLMDTQFSLPKIENFVAKKTVEQKQGYQSKNGENYMVTEYKWILFPVKEGQYAIPKTEVSYYQIVKKTQQKKSRRSSDPFDRDFFSSPFEDDDFFAPFFSSNHEKIPRRKFSEPVNISVLPLPEQDRPADFRGTVGSYEMSVRVSPEKDHQAGDPINMTVAIKGTGNIQSIAEPVFAGEESFRSFPPESSFTTEQSENYERGEKTFKKVFIPQSAGKGRLPSVSFSFFDPVLKTYRTLSGGGQEISVERSKNPMPQAVQETRRPSEEKKDSVEYKTSDIITVKDSPGDAAKHLFRLSGAVMFLLYLAAPLLILLAELLKFLRDKRNADPLLARRLRAYSRFRKEEANLRKLLHGEQDQFYNRMSEALAGYVSDKAGLPAAGITQDVIVSVLLPRGLTSDAAENLRKVFESIDMARFSVSDKDAARRKNDLALLSEAVKEMEKSPLREGGAA